MKRASVLLLYKESRPLRHRSERPAKARAHLGKISSSLSYSVQLISMSTALGNIGAWRHRSHDLTQIFSSINKGSLQNQSKFNSGWETQKEKVPSDALMCSCIINNGTERAFRGRQVINDISVCVYVRLLLIHPKHNPILKSCLYN